MVCYNCFKEKSSYGPCPFCGYDPAGAEEKYPLALKAGSILNGRYTVGRVIGQGGFGITYIAQDYQTKERVAIKEFLPTDFAGRDSASSSVKIYSGERQENFEYGKEQFLQEAKTLAAFIGDEHIVRIYSYFEENNTAYFVMEYVDGYALDKYMAQKGGRLSVEEANHLLLPLMPSLDKVHSKGIIHRDIAPDNIIVTKDGNAKLIDFGAARYSTGEKSKSLDVILKHGFAPREQYTRRGRQGPFTDVYALAATYYYAITGKVPPDAIDRIDDDILLSPSSLGIRIPQCTEDALYKGLEVNSGNRYQRMSEFYRDMAEGSNVISDSSVERTGTDLLSNTTSRTEQEAKERAERLERELQAAKEEAARLEQERLEREAREAAARREQERKEREAQEEAARLERERIERERKEEEARKKAERLEAERKAREEAERRKREAREAEERRKKELAEKKAREEAERQEKLRLEREKRLAAEKKKQGAEKNKASEERSFSGKKGSLGKYISICAVIAAVVCAAIFLLPKKTSEKPSVEPTTTTETENRTETPAPSGMPTPTETPAPSGTHTPTETPAPTETPTPTETPAPPETATTVKPEESSETTAREITESLKTEESPEATAPIESEEQTETTGPETSVHVLPETETKPETEPEEEVEVESEALPEEQGAPVDPYADFRVVGNTVTFGSYEQDNDLENGKEPIEWIVLDVQDGKSLLISKYGLDCRPYNTNKSPVTWETSSIRKWLTGNFLNEAFNANEQEKIQLNAVKADKNPEYDTISGNDTTDKVFLLSILEAKRYFSTEEERKCLSTEYAKAQGCYTSEPESICWWWLRSPGFNSYTAVHVNRDGSIPLNGDGVDYDNVAIRPAIWVDISGTAEKSAQKIEALESEKTFISGDFKTVGSIITFGSYEQDNDLENGKEPIEWIVLDVQDGKSLLISKYALDTQPYNTEFASVTWETCSLRKWLNDAFLTDAFSMEEQALIPTTIVQNKAVGPWATSDPGNDTPDQVFLLSYQEYSSLNDKSSYPTSYAEAQGCVTNDNTGECWCWLRTPSSYDNHKTNTTASNGGSDVSWGGIGIRPVIWIDCSETSDFSKEMKDAEENSLQTVGSIVTFGSYEQDNNLENGPEPIEWIVLDVQDGKSMLISKKGLDYKDYNDIYTSITWEECTLRSWLNSSFLNDAFSTEDQKAILTTSVNNSMPQENSNWITTKENDTLDMIFLLSYTEAYQYFSSDEDRLCKPTPYAVTRTTWPQSDVGFCSWWLRSSGNGLFSAAQVSKDGRCDESYVNRGWNAVRPVIWVNWE